MTEGDVCVIIIVSRVLLGLGRERSRVSKKQGRPQLDREKANFVLVVPDVALSGISHYFLVMR